MTSSLPDPRTLARALRRLYTPQEIARVAAPVSDAYADFRRVYRWRIGDFARDCFVWPQGEGLTTYQYEVLTAIKPRTREAVRAAHGAGKTTLAAMAILGFALTMDIDEDWKIPTTASAWRQLIYYLWPEVHKWARRLDWNKIGRAPFTRLELMTMSLKLNTGEAFALASDRPSSMEGAHARAMLYVFDEAKAIPDPIWDAIEGAFSGDQVAGICAIAISTPGEPAGRFYNIHACKPGTELWRKRHITLKETYEARRIDPIWVEQMRQLWGENSSTFQNRVLGEFAAQDEYGIIPLSWIEEAQGRWQDWKVQGSPGKVTAIGFDVGGGLGGGDLSTIALVVDNRIVSEIRAIPKALDPSVATMELAGQVLGLCNAYTPRWVVGDVIGLGAGVVQRLRELGVGVIGFNAGEGTAVTDKSGEQGFMNWRAAGWWLLRELLEPESAIQLALPQDDELLGDLAAPRIKRRDSNNRIVIEAKDDIRKRIGRSTDRADAVIHALIGPALWLEAQEEGQSEVVYMGPNTKWY
jgi:hypothetical protein